MRTRANEAATVEAAAGERSPPGETLAFLRVLWGVNHGLESWSRRMKRHVGVTGPERMVVRLVGCFPGVSPGELARLLRVHPSTATWLLKRLVARGLVSRRADRSDARRVLLGLTAAGRAVDADQRGTVEAVVRAVLAGLPDRQVRAAEAVLEAVIGALGA